MTEKKIDEELNKIITNIKVERDVSPSISVEYEITNMNATIQKIKSLFKQKARECYMLSLEEKITGKHTKTVIFNDTKFLKLVNLKFK